MANVMEFPDTVEEFMELYRVTDTDHVYSNGTDYVPIFRMKQWFEHLQSLPVTRGDNLRAMTDDELAEWLECHCDCASTCMAMKPYCAKSEKDCVQAWKEWLKRECEQ